MKLVRVSLNLLHLALDWFLGPREPEPGYRARKLRQQRARREMDRELRGGWVRR